MAHFAKIDKDNIVQSVHVVDNEHLLNENGVEEESLGIAYLNTVHGVEHTWVQTSYNRNIRGRFAFIGDTWDKDKDYFIPPKPSYDSWIFDEDVCEWVAPVEWPDYDKEYVWNEDTTSWDIDSEYYDET
jgi:hypothetical protein